MVMLHSLCHTVWMTLDLYSVSPRKCLSQGGHCPKRGGGHFGDILLKDANLHLLNKNKLFIWIHIDLLICGTADKKHLRMLPCVAVYTTTRCRRFNSIHKALLALLTIDFCCKQYYQYIIYLYISFPTRVLYFIVFMHSNNNNPIKISGYIFFFNTLVVKAGT